MKKTTAELLREPESMDSFCGFYEENRTQQYAEALAQGTQIQTFYQRYDEACEGVHADYYEIKRITDGTVQYDLVIWLAYDD